MEDYNTMYFSEIYVGGMTGSEHTATIAKHGAAGAVIGAGVSMINNIRNKRKGNQATSNIEAMKRGAKTGGKIGLATGMTRQAIHTSKMSNDPLYKSNFSDKTLNKATEDMGKATNKRTVSDISNSELKRQRSMYKKGK
jgi:hypothetical protein